MPIELAKKKDTHLSLSERDRPSELVFHETKAK